MSDILTIRNKKTGEVVKIRRKQREKQPEMEKQNIFGKIFNVPGASIRSAIQGKGFTQGAIQPSSVPKFQDLAIQQAQQFQSPTMNALVGMPASAAGMVADYATNPADLLMSLVGGIGGKAISKTGAGQAVGRFMTKERSLRNVFKYDSALNQSIKAKNGLDTLRANLGKAKQLAIQEVADVPAELDFSGNMSEKVVKAIQNPIYKVEFTSEGGVKPTIGNLDKVKEAVGELISSPKVWEDASGKAELKWAKQFYGRITESMKKAAKGAGKPIDDALEAYHQFMKRYYLVNKTFSR